MLTLANIAAIEPAYGAVLAMISPYFDTLSRIVQEQHMWIARRHQLAVALDPAADDSAALLAFVQDVIARITPQAVPATIYGTPDPVATPLITDNRLVPEQEPEAEPVRTLYQPEIENGDGTITYMPPVYPLEYDPATGIIQHADEPWIPDAPPKAIEDEVWYADEVPPQVVADGGQIFTTAFTPLPGDEAAALLPAQQSPVAIPEIRVETDPITGEPRWSVVLRSAEPQGAGFDEVGRMWDDFLAWLNRDTIIANTPVPNMAIAGASAFGAWWMLGGRGRR